MPLSGVLAWLVIIYMNRDRGDKETSSRGRISVQAGRQEGRRTNGNGERGTRTGKYVQARLCGFQLRTLLDKPIDDTFSKPTSGLLLSGRARIHVW